MDTPPPIYEIRIAGHLSPQWMDWFEGLTVTLENGDTLLSGPVADQAALHGLLKKVRDLGMPLVSVNQVQFDETHQDHSKQGVIKMNTTNARPHGMNKETARNPLDVRIILAALWIAGMLSSLNGDTYRLNDPVVLKSSLANTGAIVVTPGLLFVMALIFVGPIFMSVLTLTLKSPVSRRANRILGIFYALAHLAFWALTLVNLSAGRVGIYEIVWYTAQLVFACLVVWYAWKWTIPEG